MQFFRYWEGLGITKNKRIRRRMSSVPHHRLIRLASYLASVLCSHSYRDRTRAKDSIRNAFGVHICTRKHTMKSHAYSPSIIFLSLKWPAWQVDRRSESSSRSDNFWRILRFRVLNGRQWWFTRSTKNGPDVYVWVSHTSFWSTKWHTHTHKRLVSRQRREGTCMPTVVKANCRFYWGKSMIQPSLTFPP